jgi:ferredoxin
VTDLIERPASDLREPEDTGERDAVVPMTGDARAAARKRGPRKELPAGVPVPYLPPEPTAPGFQHERNKPRRLDYRPESRPDTPIVIGTDEPLEDTHAERILTTQAPQRPQATARIRIEVDGRVVEGFEGQTILEVCRDNGIEIPTLCYEPKLPGFGACRMCVVEVEGEEHPPIS